MSKLPTLFHEHDILIVRIMFRIANKPFLSSIQPRELIQLYTVPLRYTLTAQTRFIRTYAYGYTHIRVWLYAHTRIVIRT